MDACMDGPLIVMNGHFDRYSLIVVNTLSRSYVSFAGPLHSHLLSLRTWGQADRHDIFFSSFQYRLDCPQWKKVRVIRTDIINSENKITWIHPKTSLATDMVHYQTHFVHIGTMDSSISHPMWTYIYPMRCAALRDTHICTNTFTKRIRHLCH